MSFTPVQASQAICLMTTVLRMFSIRTARTKRVIRGLAVVLCLLVLLTGALQPVAALTSEYQHEDPGLRAGMAVAVIDGSSDNALSRVERAALGNASRTVGVVVSQQSNVLQVATGSTLDTVYVAGTGEAPVFVTDLNGLPKTGDLLAPSPIRGVLMRAVTGTEGVLGVALEDFPEATAETVALQPGSGVAEARVGIIRLNMDVKTTVRSDGAAGFLQRLGRSLTGREVSSTQAFIALITLTLTIVVVGGIIYAAISSYMTSLGRNPLAKGVLKRGLINVSGLVVAALAVGLGSTYLVLWM